MVLKPAATATKPAEMFENDVKMYGTQAQGSTGDLMRWFENDVKMYGTQAALTSFHCIP